MKTVKTAVVVVVLLGVLYGVYVVLNQPESQEEFEKDWEKYGVEDFQIETGDAFAGDAMGLQPFDPTAEFQPPQPSPMPPNGMNAFDAIPPEGEFQPPVAGEFQPPPAFANSSVGGEFSAPEATVYTSTDPNAGQAPPAAPPTQPPAAVAPSAVPQGVVNNPYAAKSSSTIADPTTFEASFAEVQAQVQNNQFVEALRALTAWYDRDDLTPMQQVQVSEWIDLLAKKVVYSTEHHLEPPYVIRTGDTIETVAAKYQVSPELLRNINAAQIGQSNVLVPGSKLKVVRGPFRAEVNLQRQKLTLFVNDLYAGRFDVSVGQDPAPTLGAHTVLDKRPGAPYYPTAGGMQPVGHPDNPYGGHWLGLTESLSLHGTARSASVPADKGCISLSPLDAKDVYGILAKGSKVIVR